MVSLVAGAVAGGVEAAATYPFEFAKTRVQLHSDPAHPRPRNPFLVVSEVLRKEGARALYKGCSSLIIGSMGKDAVRFLSFDAIKNAYKDPQTGALTPMRNMLAGMTAGVVASIFAVTPTERIKTALIDDAREEKRFRSGLHAVRVSTRKAGATAFRMGTYNILKDYESTRHIEQSVATNFANGSIAGIITTYATQPFDTIKTRSQSARGATTVEAFRGILADDGVRGLWRGTVMRLGRTIFSGGILFTVYEQVAALLDPIMAPKYR
ncbi:mitochondrial carrier domain-containing protein [Fomitopsis serialis]|uniref:mitochondrial carrier domain-containing protein n=1 Tax=Fomitopsis serialis TaxID=139415 RepID=UPI002007D8A9|nr:mitochondrial carrier domain-containing protein [Neoantrodia serialis]KAH9928166.1 mitochondrial carrier domain-containing protein [Neoantrodia serialis]